MFGSRRNRDKAGRRLALLQTSSALGHAVVAVALLKGPSAANKAQRKAVEMPGLWKAWKAKGRLPPLSPSP
jgi:hypothetical protein